MSASSERSSKCRIAAHLSSGPMGTGLDWMPGLGIGGWLTGVTAVARGVFCFCFCFCWRGRGWGFWEGYAFWGECVGDRDSLCSWL